MKDFTVLHVSKRFLEQVSNKQKIETIIKARLRGSTILELGGNRVVTACLTNSYREQTLNDCYKNALNYLEKKENRTILELLLEKVSKIEERLENG